MNCIMINNIFLFTYKKCRHPFVIKIGIIPSNFIPRTKKKPLLVFQARVQNDTSKQGWETKGNDL